MNSVSSLAQQFKPFLDWNKPRIELLAMLIVAILKKRTVNWTQLITTFPTTVKGDSCYRRVQRFFCEVSFDQNTIALLIAHLFAPNEPWTLSMDRTNWMFGVFKINILYLAINYKGMSIPLLWTLLDKKGNSNTTERIELMDRFLKIFPTQRVKRLLADRGFKGKEWLKYLITNNWAFCLRVANNTKVLNKHKNQEVPVCRIFSLAVGEQMVLQKPRKVWGQMVYLAAARAGEELMVVICNAEPSTAIADYLQRWQIETMFQALKGRGFNMEATCLKSREKMSKLLAILALTFCWSYKTGEYINEERPIKVKAHGRKAQTLFRAGLDHLQRILDNVDLWLEELSIVIEIFFEPRWVKAS